MKHDKTVIKKLLVFTLLLSLLTSCTEDNSEDYIVINRGEKYLLMNTVDKYTSSSVVEQDEVIFDNGDIKVNINDVYTYKDIDINDFWNYIVKKKQLDVENKPLVLAAIRHLDSRPIGAEMIFVLDNNEDWLVYSYSSIIHRGEEYYSLNYVDTEQIITQNFDNPMPCFALLHYDKPNWPISKYKSWFELNSYVYYEYEY